MWHFGVFSILLHHLPPPTPLRLEIRRMLLFQLLHELTGHVLQPCGLGLFIILGVGLRQLRIGLLYNANGNNTSGAGRTITYDHENRISQITKGGTTTSFSYDDAGQRLTKSVGNTVTVYWFGNYEETYVSGSSTETIKYYTANGMTAAQRSSVDGLLYIHSDHLESSTKLTNGSVM